MVTLLLHLLRLLPMLCGGHRQVAPGEPCFAPPARRLQEDGEPAEVAQQRSAVLGRVVQGVGRLEASSRHRVTQHRPAMAAPPLPRVLGQTLRASRGGTPARKPPDPGSRRTNGLCLPFIRPIGLTPPAAGRAESLAQYSRKRWRCHRRTVLGDTMTRACLQPAHPLDNATQNSRSLRSNFGRFIFL